MPIADNQEDSKTCLNIARSALKKGNILKAERLVLKSDRLYPNDAAKAFLIVVTAAKNANNTNNGNDFKRNSKTEKQENDFSLAADKDDAEKCIRVALKAIFAGNLEKAKRFLEKAEKLYPTEHAKELLKQVTGEEPKKPGYKESSTDNKVYKENNKEVLETCIDKAQDAFNAGDYHKAIRFLNKSEQFGDDIRVKNLMAKVLAAKDKDDANGTKEKKPKNRTDKPKNKPPPERQEDPKRTGCTEEQLSTIRRVMEAKDDYELLGVPQNADLSVIRRAKLKMLLLLHPDQNPARAAHECFLKLTDAIERLTLSKKGKKKKN